MLKLTPDAKIGLVLAGGGARGAYEVGALQYLADIGFVPWAIAGTSIGALNGAVVASEAEFSRGVERLTAIWKRLSQEQLFSGSDEAIPRIASFTAQLFLPDFRRWLQPFLKSARMSERLALFNPEPIERLLRETIDPEAIRNGIELWVTVFPCLKIPHLNYDLLLDLGRSLAGTPAEWLRVRDCQDDETLYNLLLASASIPLAFPQREVNGRYYVDGALGDNVPLGALAARGCTHAIVIHLGQGTRWDRWQFPNQTILEIRPSQTMLQRRIPGVAHIDSLLDFSGDRIARLIQLGRDDARSAIEPLLQTCDRVQQQRHQTTRLQASTQALLEDFNL